MEASSVPVETQRAHDDALIPSADEGPVPAPNGSLSGGAEEPRELPPPLVEAVRLAILNHLQAEESPLVEHVEKARVENVEEDVHSMLATSAARQRTFQELRDNSLDIGVRDMRKCDYPMTPVPRAPSARRHSARRGSRPLQQSPDNEQVKSHGEGIHGSADSEVFVWRRHLDAHTAHLLAELRRRPDQLRTLLAAHYPNGRDADRDDPSENEVVVDDRHDQSERRQSLVKETSIGALHRQKRPFLTANDVYTKLTEVGLQFGEAIYHQIRKMLLKSVKSGVIDRSSNLIRLESMFKVELRRQVTLERLQEAVLSKLDVHQKQKPQGLVSQNTARADPAALNQGQSAESNPDPDTGMVRGQEGERAESEITLVMTAHHFKMQALERVLANASRPNMAEYHDSSMASLPRQRSDQLADQIQDKVTAAVYSKNRENYPFWKDPPENGLSREETTKLLRAVTSLLANVSAFASLTIDQLIELGKHTRWRTLAQGTKICVKDTPMDNLFVVLEGSVSADDRAMTPTIGAQQAFNKFDDRRSVESSLGIGKVCLGELGLLSKIELWPSTVCVCSASSKVLTLSRDSFDAALSKMFGGGKRLIVSRDGSIGKRPTSSPAATRLQARPGRRPSTSSVREQAIAKFQQYRDEYTRRIPDDSSAGGITEETSDTQETATMDEPKVTTTNRPRTSVSSSVYQHYPTFPVVEGRSAGAHMFRLKCIQPIAFGMKSAGELIQDEWAPAFPDTSTLVEYMSAAENSFLFEKRNVLIKHNIRAVCTNLPFQDDSAMRNRADEYLSYYQDTQADAVTQESSFTNAAVTFAEPTNTSAAVGSSGASAYAIASTVDGDPMTLGQFADARRRISSKVGALSGGSASPSMRNVFGSAATSATLAKHGNAPFVNSCFVPETSFHDDLRNFVGSQAEGDEEDEEEASIGNHHVLSKTPVEPEVDEDDDTSSHVTSEHSAAASDSNKPNNPTKARKMALDSIINTMTDRSPAKRKMTDHEAARRVILQKHLYAANEGPSTPSKPTDGRKRSLLQAGPVDQTAGVVSHAPLPLRVDLQRRMEAVLAALKMKPKAKLDLVLKYTHADNYDHFPDAVVLWEQAAHYVLKREKALDSLRKFELVASDPRRHFRSLSTNRLTEQKERDALFYQLNYASDLCRESLDELEKRCGDVVYLEHRLYRDKMKKDYTELLYEVEQERLRMIYKGIHPVVADNRSSSKAEYVRGNQQEDVTSRRVAVADRQRVPTQVVAGSSSVLTESRFTLSTPRESIYVPIVDRFAQEEREEKDERANPKPQRPVHKLSAQVKQHRQAQLDGIASHPPSNNAHTHAAPAKPDISQVRTASPVAPVASQTSSMASIKQALENALGRR